MIPLMRPYVWQGTFIPIVPSELIDCIQSPVPYILGVASIPADIDTLPYVMFLDADQGKILQMPEGLAPLPTLDALRARLQPIHEQFHVDSTARSKFIRNPFAKSNNKEQQALLSQFLDEMKTYHIILLKFLEAEIRSMGVSIKFDLHNVSHRQKLVTQFPDDLMRSFMEEIMETQHFHFLFDTKIKEVLHLGS